MKTRDLKAAVPKQVCNIVLTRKDIGELIHLLGVLRTHLSSAIESTLVPGERQPREQIYRESVELDRCDLREAVRLSRMLREMRASRKAFDSFISRILDREHRKK